MASKREGGPVGADVSGGVDELGLDLWGETQGSVVRH